MSRFLLLLILLLTAGTTLSFGQSDPILGRATSFSALAATRINVTGTDETIIYGNIGVSPGNTIHDQSLILLRDGRVEKGTEWAAEAMRDAKIAYETLGSRPVMQEWNPTINSPITLKPGVHRFDGNTSISDRVFLDAEFNNNALFIIIIEGDFMAQPGMGQVLQNSAEERNVFWLVRGKVNINMPASFKGNIISIGDITLSEAAPLEGRAISLQGAINFIKNIVFLPTTVKTNLAVDKKTEVESVKLGDKVTYTITATNTGPDDASGVVVKERIPSGLKLVEIRQISKGNYDLATNQWLIGDLALNETVVLKLVFEIVGTGNIKNEVIIIGNEPDPNPTDDEDEVELPELPDLSLTKTVNGGPDYYVGDIVQYTITVTNKAKGAQTNVNVREQLPAGLQYLEYSATAGTTFDPVTGIFNIPTLAGNSSATLTISAKLVLAGRVRNVATIIGRTPDNDKDPNNDEDDEEIIVKCPTPAVAITTPQLAVCGETEFVFTASPLIIGATYNFVLSAGLEKVAQVGNVLTVRANRTSGSRKVTVTVTDQCKQTATAEVTVEVTGTPAAITIKDMSSNAVCFNSSGITLEAAQVTEGLDYRWTVEAGLEIVGATNGTSVVVKPKDQSLAGGKVTLTVTNACGFSASTTKTLTITPPPTAPASISGKATVCAGETVTYTAAIVAGASGYTWTLPAGWAFVPGTPTDGQQVTVVAGTAGGQIAVAARVEACDATSATTALAVAVTNVPEAPAGITGNTTPCVGQEYTYDVTNPVNGAEYAWTLPAGWSFAGSRTGSSVKVTPATNAAAGEITVAMKNACFTGPTVALTVTPNQKPQLGVISGPATGVCVGSSGNVYSVEPVANATSYTWTLPAGWAFAPGTPADGPQITVVAGATGGTIKVKATNNCGDSNERSYSVGVQTIPALPTAITGPANLCEGETRAYSVTAVAGVTYNWTVPAGWEIIGDRDKATANIKVGTTSGRVELTVTNVCGTSTNNVNLPITVNNKPAAPAITGAGTTGCIGEKLTFSIEAPVAGQTYTWSVPNGWSANRTTGNSIEVTIGETSGDIKVYATNQCGDGTEVRLAVSPILKPATPGAISNNMNVCVNSTGNTFSVAAVTGATSYEWEVPAGWAIEGAATGSSISVTATGTGGMVRVRAINRCGVSDWSTLNIAITMPPAPVTRITDNSNVCDGLTYTADAVAGATSYNWEVSEGFTIESGQGTTTIKVKASNPNAVGRVSVTTFNGSCAGSAAFSIDMDAKLADGQLDFPKAFSPNGDGKNDTWLVKNLEKFPDNEMVVFNRWGSEVYKQRNYKNDWAAKGLEQGTYFYKVRVRLCDGVYQDYSGYVTIFR